MNHLTYFRHLMIALAVSSLILSCEKEELKKPEILNFELGNENGKTVYPSENIGLDADIVAENDIDRIELLIHYNGSNNSNNISFGQYDNEWEFEMISTEFSGQKNTSFSQVIEIPANTKPGKYNLHLKVVDKEGYNTEIIEVLEVLMPENTEVPVITITKAPYDGQVFQKGYTISISGTITHSIAIEEIYIGLVRGDSDLGNAEINSQNSITMFYETDFDDPSVVNFDASIITGTEYDNHKTPKEVTGDIEWQDMNYFILVRTKAAFNGPAGFSERFLIKIEGCECEA